MSIRGWFKGYAIYCIVLLISLLLAGNVFMIYRNSQRIEHNKTMYENADKVKANTVEIIRNLHLLDMSLRSFALVKQEKFLALADNCIFKKDSIFENLEGALLQQGYPMENFYAMRKAVEEYYGVVRVMRQKLVQGSFDEFVEILQPDPGYKAWENFGPFSAHVNAFEDRISQKAQADYQSALRYSYLLQIILCVIAIPTLLYTAFYSTRSINLSEQLSRSNAENYKIIAEQNAMLEKMVAERTREIVSQRNELREQNTQLQEAQRIISLQNEEIQRRHDELEREVDRQTQNLKKTNLELVEYNNRLEQFAYIISHNLRAPMARLTGLASLLDHARNEVDSRNIIRMMTKSTSDLDQVIKDLSTILGVQKSSSAPVTEVNLRHAVDKVTSMLDFEIKESNARVSRNLEIETLYSLPPYIDSILYNLISNALKYRHPERVPEIAVHSKLDNEMIRIDVADNGLGIDLEQNRDNIFNLYKRFHFHVEGKGMGLYLVKAQITALGGRIDVTSKMLEGTTFSLFFANKNPGLYADN